MTLQSVRPISIGDVAVELSIALPLALGDARVRTLANVLTGPVTIGDLLGKSALGGNLAESVYTGKSVSVSAQATAPTGVCFGPDGLKMYLSDQTTDCIYQYTLSIAWDVSTAVYVNKLASLASLLTDLAVSPDGTKLYCVDNSGDCILGYTLSTAWDVSTAVYDGYGSVWSQATSPIGVALSSDGLKMYVLDFATDCIYQYTLATAWDQQTATYANRSVSVTAQVTSPESLAFNSNGLTMYVGAANSTKVCQYTLATAWDVSTAVYANKLASVGAQTSPQGITFSTDNFNMYVVGSTSATVFQYSLR